MIYSHQYKVGDIIRKKDFYQLPFQPVDANRCYLCGETEPSQTHDSKYACGSTWITTRTETQILRMCERYISGEISKMNFRQEDLEYWIKYNKNVLFEGHFGTGKSSIILQAFEKYKLNYKYFSASTMDVWVDLVGVPRVVKSGNKEYLELIKLKSLDFENVEAIFFDELNRPPTIKIINAVMELIQFKSINGYKFPKLRMVWGAMNPANNENIDYAVDTLDAAHIDRFHMHVKIDYLPEEEYFKNKFPLYYQGALKWWKELDAKNKYKVSPRRLDYALETLDEGGEVHFVLPECTGVKKFISDCLSCGLIDIIQKFYGKNDNASVQNLFKNNNSFETFKHYLMDAKAVKIGDNMMTFCLRNMSGEQVAILLHYNANLRKIVVDKMLDIEYIQNVVKNIIDSGLNTALGTELSNLIHAKIIATNDAILATAFNLKLNKSTNEIPIYQPKSKTISYIAGEDEQF